MLLDANARKNMNLRMWPCFLMWPKCDYILGIFVFTFRDNIRNQKEVGCSTPIKNLIDDQRRVLMGRCTELSLHEGGI